MNIQTITKNLIDLGIEPNEAKCEIKILLEHFFNYSSEDIARGKQLTPEQLEQLQKKVLLRVQDRLPVQYITGEAWFMGEFFKVTPDVLIPRDETEILVSQAIDLIKKNDFQTVLDIGTGSGCIACTIAKKTGATVLGVDISSDALRIALDNVTKLKINNRAVFRKSDLFEKIRNEEKFDIIISNPPYIPVGTQLAKEVQHEPYIALFADENGLQLYRKIIEKAPNYLNNDGYLMFEVGINEAEFVKEMMENDFCEIVITKDLAGIDRTVIGRLKLQ